MEGKTVGVKIQEARRLAGLKQWQLANMVNVSESYIALIESDKRNPSITVLVKIAEVLGLTTDQIVFDVDARSDTSFTLEWQNIVRNRSPKEIESALKMLQSYFSCLDDLKN